TALALYGTGCKQLISDMELMGDDGDDDGLSPPVCAGGGGGLCPVMPKVQAALSVVQSLASWLEAKEYLMLHLTPSAAQHLTPPADAFQSITSSSSEEQNNTISHHLILLVDQGDNNS